MAEEIKWQEAPEHRVSNVIKAHRPRQDIIAVVTDQQVTASTVPKGRQGVIVAAAAEHTSQKVLEHGAAKNMPRVPPLLRQQTGEETSLLR